MKVEVESRFVSTSASGSFLSRKLRLRQSFEFFEISWNFNRRTFPRSWILAGATVSLQATFATKFLGIFWNFNRRTFLAPESLRKDIHFEGPRSLEGILGVGGTGSIWSTNGAEWIPNGERRAEDYLSCNGNGMSCLCATRPAWKRDVHVETRRRRRERTRAASPSAPSPSSDPSVFLPSRGSS